MALQVFRAARDDRLIWVGPNSFAVLRAPADRAHGTDGGVLRLVDRHWPIVVQCAAFAGFLGVVLVLVGLSSVVSRNTVFYGSSTALLLMLGFLTVDLGALPVRWGWRAFRPRAREAPGPDTVASEQLPFEQWSLMLCHHVEITGASALLDEVERRLVALGGADEPLVCSRDAITTARMRTRVAEWAEAFPTTAAARGSVCGCPGAFPHGRTRSGRTAALSSSSWPGWSCFSPFPRRRSPTGSGRRVWRRVRDGS